MSPPSPVTVRPATRDDAAALGRLGAMLVAVHHKYDRRRFIAPTPRTARGYGSFLASQLDEKDTIILVAEEAGAVVGYTYAGIEGHDWMTLRGPAGAIYDILVDQNRRGGGIGRRLLDATLAELAARGAPQVVLSTAYPNAGAQRLFASAGFRPTMIEMTKELPGS